MGIGHLLHITTVDIRNFVGRFFGAASTSAPSAPVDSWMQAAKENYDYYAANNREMRDIKRSIDAARRERRKSEQRVDKQDSAKIEAQKRFEVNSKILTAMIKKRATEGATFDAGYVGGNPKYFKDRFSVGKRLPSEDSAMKKLFVSSTAANVKSGKTKELVEESPRRVKILALDDTYVCVNDKMCRVIRIDIDNEFTSYDNLIESIQACGVRLPNLVVGYTHDDQTINNIIYNPHLLYLIKDPVNMTETGLSHIKKYFIHVRKALTEALIPSGADIGGLTNPNRVKNPVSPFWTTFEPYSIAYTLSELNETLPKQAKTQRVNIDINDIINSEDSNRLFHALRLYAYRECRKYKINDDLDGFTDAVANFGSSIATRCGHSQASGEETIVSVVKWSWSTLKSKKNKPTRLQNETQPCVTQTVGKSVGEAMAIGGKYTAAKRREDSIQKLRHAYEAMISTNIVPTNKTLAERSGLSISTVARYKKLLDLSESNTPCASIVKKAETDTDGLQNEKCSPDSSLKPKLLITQKHKKVGVAQDIDEQTNRHKPDVLKPAPEATNIQMTHQLAVPIQPIYTVNLNKCDTEKASTSVGKLVLTDRQNVRLIMETTLPIAGNNACLRTAFDVLMARTYGQGGEEDVICIIENVFREYHMPLPHRYAKRLIVELEEAYYDSSSLLNCISHDIVATILPGLTLKEQVTNLNDDKLVSNRWRFH